MTANHSDIDFDLRSNTKTPKDVTDDDEERKDKE